MELSKNTLKRAILTLISGYASALLFLVAAGSVMIRMAEPDKLAPAVGIAAVMAGAVVMGLVTRLSGRPVSEALVTGLAYGVILFIISAALGGGSAISLPVRAIVFLIPSALTGLISLIPSSAVRRRRSRASGAAVNRYINNSRLSD